VAVCGSLQFSLDLVAEQGKGRTGKKEERKGRGGFERRGEDRGDPFEKFIDPPLFDMIILLMIIASR